MAAHNKTDALTDLISFGKFLELKSFTHSHISCQYLLNTLNCLLLSFSTKRNVFELSYSE